MCDAAGQCLHTNNSAACDDANPCTTADTCALGTCVGGPIAAVCIGSIDLTGDWQHNLPTINPGDIILVHTGMANRLHDPDYYESAQAVPNQIAELAVKGRASLLGVDAGSVDSDPFPIHKQLLTGDVLIIENLANLNQLLHIPKFEVIALPLNLNIEASPARVLARVK